MKLCVISGRKLPQLFSHISLTCYLSALYETLNEDVEKILYSHLFIQDLKLQFVYMSRH